MRSADIYQVKQSIRWLVINQISSIASTKQIGLADSTKGIPSGGTPPGPGGSFSEILGEKIKELSADWKAANSDASLHMRSVPEPMKDLFNLQAKVNSLQFQVNTASRIGDTVAHSIKRLQQAQG